MLACVLLVACDSTPVSLALTPQSPVERVAVAQAQMTTTQIAAQVEQAAPALTEQALRLQAQAQAVSATGTAIANRATAEAAHATATAQALDTQAAIVARITQQAIDESAIKNSQRAALILTQAAGEARSEESRLAAQSTAWYVLFIGGALAAVLVVLGIAVRFTGQSILYYGDAQAAKIKAQGDAYAAGVTADAQARATDVRSQVFSHLGALIHVGDGGQANILYRPAMLIETPNETAPAQPPMVNSVRGTYPLLPQPDRTELVKFLYRCTRAAGEQAELIDTIPSDDTLRMGAERRRMFVGQLEAMGFACVVPNVGTKIVGYKNLLALAHAVENGAGVIPSPTPKTTSESDDPFPGNGWNGQTGQNTLRSGTAVER